MSLNRHKIAIFNIIDPSIGDTIVGYLLENPNVELNEILEKDLTVKKIYNQLMGFERFFSLEDLQANKDDFRKSFETYLTQLKNDLRQAQDYDIARLQQALLKLVNACNKEYGEAFTLDLLRTFPGPVPSDLFKHPPSETLQTALTYLDTFFNLDISDRIKDEEDLPYYQNKQAFKLLVKGQIDILNIRLERNPETERERVRTDFDRLIAAPSLPQPPTSAPDREELETTSSTKKPMILPFFSAPPVRGMPEGPWPLDGLLSTLYDKAARLKRLNDDELNLSIDTLQSLLEAKAAATPQQSQEIYAQAFELCKKLQMRLKKPQTSLAKDTLFTIFNRLLRTFNIDRDDLAPKVVTWQEHARCIEQNRIHAEPVFADFRNALEKVRLQTSQMSEEKLQCYVIYTDADEKNPHEAWLSPFIYSLISDLTATGIEVHSKYTLAKDERIEDCMNFCNRFILLGSQSLMRKLKDHDQALQTEMVLVEQRRRELNSPVNRNPVIPCVLSGTMDTALPAYCQVYEISKFSNDPYLDNLKKLIRAIHRISVDSLDWNTTWKAFEKQHPRLSLTRQEVLEHLENEKTSNGSFRFGGRH